MFITRPRSLYRNFPRTLFVQSSSQATYSGYLVATDEESEEMDTFCCGMCKNNKISRLPFPQDRILKVVHTSEHQESHVTKVWFLPVPGQPLSSHRYFVIQAKGRHKGYDSMIPFFFMFFSFLFSSLYLIKTTCGINLMLQESIHMFSGG